MPPDTATAVAEPTSLPAIRKPPAEALRQLERVVLEGNLKGLTEGERVAYYARVCESLGLNPLTRPFEYIELQGKLTLYARKDAGDQLRDIHGVSIERIERERDADLGLAIVTAYARDRYGRVDSSIGSVSIKGLSGEAMANALMKAETKAKRRVTLSICGLGWMDEIEALDARQVEVIPRQQLRSAIASRTAVLTGGNGTGESEGGAIAARAEPEGVRGTASSGGSPTCAHPQAQHEVTDAGVVCGDCGTLIAERTPETKARRTRKPTEPKKAGDPGYWRARAHAVADERGIDPDALKRITGDLLDLEGDWSRTTLTEELWEYIAGVVSSAPVRNEDEATWLSDATVFAGNQAIGAGLTTVLDSDEAWAPVEDSASDTLGIPVDDITPAGWAEYGLRIAAKAS